MKIGILTNMPTPYRKKMWEKLYTIPNIDINIFYCTKREKDRFWNISYNKKEIFLRGITYKTEFHFNFEIVKYVKKQKFWLIGGYSSPTYFFTIFLCILFKIPYGLIIDGVNPKILEKKKKGIKEIIRIWAIKNQTVAFANGRISKSFLEKYNFPDEKIFNQFLSVDNKYFYNFRKDKEKLKNEFRKKYSVSDKTITLLYVGRLVKGKGIEDIINFVIKNKDLNIKLFIVGKGLQENDLKKISEDSKKVVFLGNYEYKKLYNVYYGTDILILPSYSDVWGLVLNEGMACGMPVISTTSCGAYLDLIKGNGFYYEAGDLYELRNKFLKFFGKERDKNFNEISEKISNKSLELSSLFNYDNSKKEFEKMIEYIKN